MLLQNDLCYIVLLSLNDKCHYYGFFLLLFFYFQSLNF